MTPEQEKNLEVAKEAVALTQRLYQRIENPTAQSLVDSARDALMRHANKYYAVLAQAFVDQNEQILKLEQSAKQSS